MDQTKRNPDHSAGAPPAGEASLGKVTVLSSLAHGKAPDRPFRHHRAAALALLNGQPDLPHKAAGFLGHVCVAPSLTEKQSSWLVMLLQRYGMPSLVAGGAQ